ncbi:type II toxin-antitoxin system Phd/YefM family antitoxin [Nitrococcus mobilis]|uniref:Antitoxin n=1 Tax=Nitrococcus mobilis Nb-231 TaxID=314278 RepID=A4BL10_9GAMM|nr:type II toxin-antitoxin system prevent-host-death family antitoxin [Nitrococcus mobilis]EAR22998.1 hypothetical protein NB231_14298 [Nitrococcus mobilis Nb-231]
MIEISLTEARRRLSELLDRAEAGDRVAILRRGHPPSELVRHVAARGPLPDITEEVNTLDIQGETVLEAPLPKRSRILARF